MLEHTQNLCFHVEGKQLPGLFPKILWPKGNMGDLSANKTVPLQLLPNMEIPGQGTLQGASIPLHDGAGSWAGAADRSG